MCWNCGCMRPDDNHGNPNNITTATLMKAAKAGGPNNLHRLLKNFERMHEEKIHGTAIDVEPVYNEVREYSSIRQGNKN